MADATNDLESQPPAKPTPLGRRKLRVFAWIVGIVVIAGMAVAVTLPSLCKARETPNRAKCASNLHQIGLAIAMYAQDNSGHYPPFLATLFKDEQLTPACMICPSGSDEAAYEPDVPGIVADLQAAETNAPGHKHCMSYIYVGQKLTVSTVSPTSIIAYEPLSNHQDEGTNVLFGDGHSEWLEKTAWLKTASSAGISILPSISTRP